MEPVQDVTEIEAKKTSMKNVFLWSSYDAADTLFSQAILSIAFQPYILILAYQMGVTDYGTAFMMMSIFMAVSNLLAASLGPILGALSDTIGKRKPAVLMSASLMITATLAFMAWSNYWWAIVCFVFANVGYQSGRLFFDSMIPFISKTDERGKTSGISGALSFIGTFVAIGLGMLAWNLWGEYLEPNILFAGNSTVENPFGGLVWLFGLTAGAIVLFSIPFLFSKEREGVNKNNFKTNFRISLKSLKSTLKEIVRYKNAWLFVLGWFLVTDAANTAILYMQLVIVDGAGATPTEALMVIAMGGLLSMVGAIVVGFLLDKFGPKKNFLINIIAWFIAVTLVILTVVEFNGQRILPWQVMFGGAFFVGLGFGGLWTIGRQFVFEIAPPNKVTQYQGIKQIAGRVSAILSPLLFLAIFGAAGNWGLSISNRYALALLPLLILFIIGFIVIWQFVDVHPEYLAGERAPYKKFSTQSIEKKKD
ncbi:MAG: MFS transporter [Candidatus Heimdallarchaeaceae archaeon]